MTFKARICLCTALFAATDFISSAAQAQVPSDMPADLSAFMPSKAEMRKSMLEADMSPAEVEGLLSTMQFPEGDEEEESSEVDEETRLECLTTYSNIITKLSRDSYGGSLGSSAVEVAQTCSMAAMGGTMKYGYGNDAPANATGDKAWYVDMAEMIPVTDYWTAILGDARAGGVDLFETEDMTADQFDSYAATLPPDLRTLIKGSQNNTGDSSENLRNISVPIHEKCENIRRRAGVNYRASVSDITVCTPFIPDLGDDSLETNEGGK